MKGKEEVPSPLTNYWSAIRGLIKAGNNDFSKMLIGNPKSSQRFPELVHASVYYGNLEMLKNLEAQGCSLTSVPKTLKPEGEKPDECVLQYKETPYLILAASRGHLYLSS